MKKSSVAWNLAGLVAPLLMALIAIPLLLSRLGADRFGLLSLVWTLTAMSGMLDLGIGRATTKFLSEALGARLPQLSSVTCATAERLSIGSGVAGGGALLIAIATGAITKLHLAPGLESEATLSAFLLAGIVPLQALIATYRGIAEAMQNFRMLNLLRITLGVANFGAPILISQYIVDLPWMVLALFAIRLLALFAFRHLAKSRMAAQGIAWGRWANAFGMCKPIARISRPLHSRLGSVDVCDRCLRDPLRTRDATACACKRDGHCRVPYTCAVADRHTFCSAALGGALAAVRFYIPRLRCVAIGCNARTTACPLDAGGCGSGVHSRGTLAMHWNVVERRRPDVHGIDSRAWRISSNGAAARDRVVCVPYRPRRRNTGTRSRRCSGTLELPRAT
jgi:hypothetical protein